TKLIAAFDHRHIFLDPEPDPAKSFAERRRLFALPRSSWADYDAKLISKGGGVFERSRKSITLSPEIRARLGVSAEKTTPAELMQAVLQAPVDLLWFGGIGTYVKSSSERHAEVGDRANDALRIDAEEIRAQVVGEGANLAVTQRARIAYALKGGRINNDAIDNSAGVDTSDHEVNIKILLDAVVTSGELTGAQRNTLLQEMTDAVAALVLADNYLQTLALSLAEAQGTAKLDEQLRAMRALERLGELSRAVEFLPDDDTLVTRAAGGRGLTRPELAVLMAYVKNTLVDALGDSELLDDAQLLPDLQGYFPPLLVERFPRAVAAHRLRREIIATFVANELVNRAGITFLQEMRERTGRSEAEVARAYAIVKALYGFDALWATVNALDNKVAASVQAEMLLIGARLMERATAWFLRGRALDIKVEVDAFRPRIAELAEHIVETLPDAERNELQRRVDALAGKGVPCDVAFAMARLDFLTSSVDVVRLAQGSRLGIVDVARRFYAIGHRFRLDTLRLIARNLKSETSWQKLAVNALIEEFYAQQAELTQQSLGESAELERWLRSRAQTLAQLDSLLRDIEASPTPDLAMLTVASRALRASIG
ncbi:MAG TPA: NAD-glutamate dehydrogenase domain-containing protein, partial [Polyangia bacterium]